MKNENFDEEIERSSSRFTGNERNTFHRRTSIMVSTATSSPLHIDKYNILLRTCDKYPLFTFVFLLLLMITTTLIGCSIYFSYRENTLDKQGSTLVLSSGDGLIAKINAYIIDLPESECHGRISSYPDGRYSQNLFDVVSGDSEDDFFQPRSCKWASDLTNIASTGPFSYPINLVGKCNINAITSAYTEGVAIVFEGDDLFKQSSLLGMCQVDNFIRNFKNYDHKCRSSEQLDSCCPSRSLPNYVAALSELNDCDDITQDAIDYAQQLLSVCHSYYLDGSLTSDCWDWDQNTSKTLQCPYVPQICTKYNAVYDMFHSLMESSYDPSGSKNLQIGKLLIPYNDTNKDWLLDLYYDKIKDRTGDSFGGAEMVAYNLRIKTEVFRAILRTDVLFLIPITFIIFVSLLIMTGLSLFLSFFSLLGIYLCFGMTWFVYGTILWMEYAPFYVFFSFALLIYIGLLFLFSYLKNWGESFDVLGPEHPDIDRLAYVWHLTSLKSFAAAGSCSCCLFAIVLFPLPSMKCFGLFSGISMIFLFLVALLFFPTVVLLNHKLYSPGKVNSSLKPHSVKTKVWNLWESGQKILLQYSNQAAEYYDIFSFHLFKWRKSAIFLLSVASCVIAYYSVYIDIDDVATPQLLFTLHPFELYDRKYDSKFRSSPLNLDSYFNMVVVFGVQNSNTVEPFNPSSKTSAKFSSLNISGIDQQKLMYEMCEYMINQKGRTDINVSIQNVQCYPYFFQQWMSVDCVDTRNFSYPDTTTWLTPSRSTCCGHDPTEISYPEDEFLSCAYTWSANYGNFDTGLWWNPDIEEIIAVTIGMDSRDKFSNDYRDGLDYWDKLDLWTSNFFRSTELRKSYSTSNMALLRYQRGLTVGINVVTPLCVCIGSLVVFFMSRNIIAAFTVLVSTYLILMILGGSVVLYNERFSLFTSMCATFAMAVGCGISSFLSHSYCEAGHAGYVDNTEIGTYLGKEVTPIIFGLTITSWLTALCLLGCGSYFTFGFGIVFISIALYCWILSYSWNLLFLTICWTKQPFGQLFVYFGFTPPPCCLVDNMPTSPSDSKSATQVSRVNNPLGEFHM